MDLRSTLRHLAAAAVLVASSCFAQLKVETRYANQVVGIGQTEQIGEGVFVASDSTVQLLPVALVRCTTDAANIAFDCSNQQRIPVEFQQLTPSIIAIDQPGKIWVDVTVIDFSLNLYGRKLVVVEIGEPDPPDPPEPPEPTPPDPPDPGPGPFDDLARRVSQAARTVPPSEARDISIVMQTVADRMQSFEYRTLTEAKAFIKRSWPDCEGCRKVYELLISDADGRLLSWQEAQSYYREVAKGVRP